MLSQKILVLVLFYLCSVISTADIGLGKLGKDHHVLSQANWTVMLEDEWLVKFYAPWCPACRHLESTWETLAVWSLERGFKVASVDVTKESGLSGRFIITSLPTIYHVKNGIFRQYTNTRTLEDLKSFMEEEKWKDVEPVSQWKSPSSFLMSCISKLFEVSMQLKDLHNSLTETYGLPVWASFVIFGGLVIIFGLILGMGMVLASDYFFGPPCPPSYPTMEEIQKDGRVVENKESEQHSEENSESEEMKESKDDEEQEHGIRKRKANQVKDEEN